MLNSATDYEYVNVTGLSSFIKGNILPVRMASANGSDMQIRYEDYLFLLEAYYERMNWDVVPSVLVTPGSRAISGSNINGATIYQPGADAAGFVDPSFTIPTVLIGSSYAGTVKAAMGIQDTSLENPQYSPTPRYLERNLVCKSYWNVKQCKRTIKAIQIADLATETKTTTRVDSNSDAHPEGSTSGNFAGIIYSTGYATRVGSYNDRYTLIPKQPLVAAAPYADSATLLLLCSGGVQPRGGTWQYSYCIFPISCTMSNGGIETPAFDVNSMCSSIASYSGMSGYNSEPFYIYEEGYKIAIIAAAVVIDHDFPAEIDSITGWNWQPSTP